MKAMRYYAIFSILFLSVTSYAMGNSQNQDTTQSGNVATDQAKQDYALLLAKLKELGQQYNQVTGQMKQVVKEQGVPVWDEKEGIKITHDLNFAKKAPMQETDKEIKIVLERPGLKKGTIRITIEDDKTLHLRAFKKSLTPGESDEAIDEKLGLPDSVTAENAKPKAQYEDGILTITLQKSLIPKKSVEVPVQ